MANCGRKQAVKHKQLSNHDMVMVLGKSITKNNKEFCV